MRQLPATILAIVDGWADVTIADAAAIADQVIAEHPCLDHAFAQFLTELIIRNYDGCGRRVDDP